MYNNLSSFKLNVSNLASMVTFLDFFGLYVLFLLLILNPFHFFFYDKLVYYREAIFAFFLILSFIKYLSKGKERLEPNYDLGLVILFPLLLLVFALFDTGKNLYNNDITEASLHLKYVNPDLYVVRNALLYVPMVVYFALRGLKDCEIEKIALVTVLIAPFSIFAFIYFYNLATFATFGTLVKLQGAGFQYNTYIPYLGFAAISATYLINSPASNRTIKYTSLMILGFLIIYIYLSTSRQSLLFISISSLFIFFKNKEIGLKEKFIFLSAFLLCVWVAFKLIVMDFSLLSIGASNGAHSINSYINSSGDIGLNSLPYGFQKYNTLKTPRWEIMKEGLNLLQPHEYFTGAGLSSVINSGPHNDYIRWLQRIGFFGMLLGIYPFFKALFSIADPRRLLDQDKKNNIILSYMMFAIIFTLFQSFFGYPREDAYQAPYCFLGLALWFGYRKEYGLIYRAVARKKTVDVCDMSKIKTT